jgi:predicted Zn finger-like uncharacterized protein
MLLACPTCATTYAVEPAVIGENGRSLRCVRCQNVWFATRSQAIVAAPEPVAAADSTESTPAHNDVSPAPSMEAPDSTTTTTTPEPSAVDGTALIGESIHHVDSPPLAPQTSTAPATPGSLSINGGGEDIESFARRYAPRPSRVQRVREQFGAPAIMAILGVVVAALLAWRVPIVQHAPQMASFYSAIGLPVNLRQLYFDDVKVTKETRDGVPVLLVEGTITSTSKYSVEVPRLRFGLRNRAGQEIFSWTALPEQTILSPGETLPFRSRLAAPPSEGNDVVVRFFNKRDATQGAR